MIGDALLAAALSFALVSGINDGGPLVAMGLKVPSMRPLTAVAWLAAALIVGPLLLGTRVATTLASHLVPFHGEAGRIAMLGAILAAVGVVSILARLGLPTSLTLATIGGFVGAGLGLGLPVGWGTLFVILGFAAMAPCIGAIAGRLLAGIVGNLPSRRSARSRLGRLHYVGFGLEATAYAANDGQRMLAVLAIALGVGGQVHARLWQLAALAAIFGVGAIIGIPRYSRTFGDDLLAARPPHGVVAELATAGVAFAGVGLGTPLSMTQTISGGLIGAGVSEGVRRVRWERASRLVLAWVLTLPAAIALAALLAGLGGRFEA